MGAAGGSHEGAPDSSGDYSGRWQLCVSVRGCASGRGTSSRGTGWPGMASRRWEVPSRDRVRRDAVEGGRTKPGTRAIALSALSPPTNSIPPIAREVSHCYIRCAPLSSTAIATSLPTAPHLQPKQPVPSLRHAQQTRLPHYHSPPCALLCDAATVMEPWHEGETFAASVHIYAR